MQLYAIADAMQAILDTIDESGEIAPEAQAQLDALEGDLAAKAEAIARVVRNLVASEAARKVEAARLALAADADRRRADWLKRYLMDQLQRLGLTRIDAGVFRVRVQRNSQPAVSCAVPLDKLPPDLVRRKETLDLDREAILAAVREGLPLPEGVRVETGTHLRIN